jgi:predicted Zn-dependent protease
MLSFSENTQGNSSEQDKQINALNRIRSLMTRNKIEEAISYYEDLPPALKDQKIIKLMYVQLCSEMDDGSYEKALNEFQQLYPGEPNMFLMMIDVYILRKEYDQALNAVNKLDMLIDSDPFLDYIRASIYNMTDEPEKARVLLEKLYVRMPDFDAGVLELIANYTDAGENEKAKQLIKDYKSNPEFNQELLNTYLYFQPQLKEEDE